MHRDVAEGDCANSALVKLALEYFLELFVFVLLRLEKRHCWWEVTIHARIKFVDGVDSMGNVLGNFIEHFEATETICASIEFTG